MSRLRSTLQRALWQLSHWFPAAVESWERLAPAWDGGALRLRLPTGQLVEPHGQRLLDFSPQEAIDCPSGPLPLNASVDLFGRAVACEQQGDWAEAEEFYRQLLREEGPDADVCFNLANVLIARHQRPAALERLWQCVELAPRFAEAWHNLGTVALELQHFGVAQTAFQEALTLAPNFSAAQIGREAATRCLNSPRP